MLDVPMRLWKDSYRSSNESQERQHTELRMPKRLLDTWHVQEASLSHLAKYVDAMRESTSWKLSTVRGQGHCCL